MSVYVIGGLKGKDFKSLLSVRYCVSKDKTKPLFCGVLFSVRSGKLFTQSLDCIRLSISSPINCLCKDDVDFSVHPSVLIKVEKAIKSKSNIVIYVDTHKDKIRFDVDGEFFDSDLLGKGHITDYSNFFPTMTKYTLEVQRSDLLSSIKHLKSISKDNKKANLCVLDINNNGLSLVLEKHLEDVKHVKCSSNCNMKIGFNLNYLHAMVNSIKEDTLMFGLVSPIKPLLHKNNVKKDLLMPINLRTRGL